MWLFTIYGFFSVVFKDGHVNVRTRVLSDLEKLLTLWPFEGEKLPEIIVTPDHDYPYRILIDHTAWKFLSKILMASVFEVSNFKDAITKHQGHARHEVYLKVWRVLANAFGTGWNLKQENITQPWKRKRR